VQATCGQLKAMQTMQARTEKEVQKSRTHEKAQAACDSRSNVAHKAVKRILRREIHADQTLRQRGEGDTLLTNPHIRVRHRFRKLYEDYKTEFMLFWKLVLICP
jgi:hypothetical protein